MAKPAEKLAVSLDLLRKLQEAGLVAIKASMLSRTHRERLLANGFIKEVFKGWYMLSPPDEHPGDSTSWYHSYWLFCAQFLSDKYHETWCISPEQSLLLHAGNWTVPAQLVIRSPQATQEVIPGLSFLLKKERLTCKYWRGQALTRILSHLHNFSVIL